MQLRVNEKRRIIAGIVLIGLIAVALVILSAYAAELRVDNNKIIDNINVLQGEIDSLNVQIKQANSIERIEEVATYQLGMVYPENEQCIYLSQQESPLGNLAMLIK